MIHMWDKDARPLTDNERAFLMEDEEADDTRREDEPGPWFVAGYDDECSRGGEPITEGDTIRADGDGGWECRECVDEDDFKAEQWDIYVESTEMLGGAA